MKALVVMLAGILVPTTHLRAADTGEILYHGFSEAQQNLLNHALTHAWKFIVSEEVMRCVDRNARLEMLSPNIANVYAGFTADGTLFSRQLPFLRGASAAGRFPSVDIVAYHREDFSWGLANLDIVTVTDAGGGLANINGRFRIGLNQYHIARNGDVTAWAGVIGHELLHNLSHAHPDASAPGAYDTAYQINTYQACVQSGGRFNDPRIPDRFRCGGRLGKL